MEMGTKGPRMAPWDYEKEGSSSRNVSPASLGAVLKLTGVESSPRAGRNVEEGLPMALAIISPAPPSLPPGGYCKISVAYTTGFP